MPNTARVALITGCGKPIGIGNSTARALAAAGMIVVVSDIAPTGVANEHNVQGDVDPNWGGVDSLVETDRQSGGTASVDAGQCQRRGRCRAHGRGGASALRTARHSGQQCRRAAGRRSQRDRGRSGGRLGPDDGRQCARRLPDVAGRGAGDAQGTLGTHHQCLVEGGVPARSAPRNLRRVQGGHRRIHQIARARSRAVRHHGECRAAWPDPHVARDQHQPARISATMWKSAFASAPRRFRSAVSAARTKWRR